MVTAEKWAKVVYSVYSSYHSLTIIILAVSFTLVFHSQVESYVKWTRAVITRVVQAQNRFYLLGCCLFINLFVLFVNRLLSLGFTRCCQYGDLRRKFCFGGIFIFFTFLCMINRTLCVSWAESHDQHNNVPRCISSPCCLQFVVPHATK